MKIKLLLLIIFILLNLLVFIITETIKTQRVNIALHTHIDNLKTSYKTIKYHQNIVVNNTMTYIKNNAMDILDKIPNSTNEEKTILRKQLYSRLANRHKEIKHNGVYQFHFTLSNNKTFLRMHKPEKYNDDLTGIRYSIEYTNKTKKPIFGFEGGKTTHAFRYVNPLFSSTNKYIGAVDISFSSDYIQQYLTVIHNKHSHLLINKDIFSKKVWENNDLKEKYYNSSENNQYMFLLSSQHNKETCIVENKKKLHDFSKEIEDKMQKGKIFNIYTKHKNKEHYDKTIFDEHIDVITFFPIESTDNKTSSWIVSYSLDDTIATTLKSVFMIRVIAFLILAILIYFTYRLLTQKDILAKKIEEKTDELNIYFNLITDGIAIADIKTKKFVDCNKAFEEMTGYTKKELCELTIDNIHPKESLEFVISEFEGQAKGEKDIAFNIPVINCKTDKTTMFDVNTDTYKKNGQAFNIGIFRNIQNRLDLENKLTELNRNLENKVAEQIEILRLNDIAMIEQSKMASMGEMIANIAHQWRQPLNVISVSASGLKIKYETNSLTKDDVNEFSEGIIKHSQYLSNTIDTFRNYIKQDKVCKNVILQDIITSSLELVKAMVNSNNITLIDKIDYLEPINIEAIEEELSQVIINIFNNAKDVLLEKNIKNPWIKLNLEKNTSSVTITIEDNAQGIPEDIISHIFEPYFTTKHKSIGTGLGLHMSYKIVTESLKGNIYVQNTNNGAKFFIEIPIKS